MKLLITGTNGFIGGNLKDFFSKKEINLFTPKRQEIDLLNESQVTDYLSQNNFDIIIHSSVTLDSIKNNLQMYFNLEKLSDKYGKLICIGSGAEFDKKNYIPYMNEEYFGKFIPDESDIYGYSKYIIAKDIIEKNKNIFNLRVFGIFGKYEDYRRRLISNNICRKLCGMQVSINKNCKFDYMYVNDFCKILEKFINSDPLKNTYNVCTGKTLDFLTAANIINKIEEDGNDVEIKNDGMNPEYSGDNSRFVKEFGDFDFTDPRESIKELYYWYKDKSGLEFNDKIFDDWKKSNLKK